ncbi:hypothetical protein F4823DRAFT_566768 [Ustulina deusta]|nr:hypothetical protein F4823DRAFT_566768 [Ustulina deusta]
MAEELGFEGLLWNAMGAVADRDFVAETLQWGGAMFMMHVSRWAEDLIVYSTAEFKEEPGLPGAAARRQERPRAGGQMTGFMTTLKGLPAEHVQQGPAGEPGERTCWTASRRSGDSVQIATGVLATLELQSVDARFERDIAEYSNYDRSVELRSARGGTGKHCVLEQIKVLREMLD